MSIRVNPTQNTPFVGYLGPADLKPVQRDWEGDNQKRMPSSGKQILSPRALLLQRRRRDMGVADSMEPSSEGIVTTPSHIKRFVDDRGLSVGPRGHSKAFPI